MGLSLGFGFGSQSSKSTTSIDPYLRNLQQQNYSGAQASLPQTYTPTSTAQIQGYLNPYTDDVVNQSLADQNRYRMMAVNQVSDAADAAGAFGGSRHGTAEALTNIGAIQQAGLLAAQLRSQGYGQALQTAQNENQFGFAYPLQRQDTLNQTLAGITPTVTQKGKGTQWGISGGIGQGSAGGKG